MNANSINKKLGFPIFMLKCLLVILSLTINSCNKNSNCYDAALEKEYVNKSCTKDCPGIVGCDGKTYCNECIANKSGIRKE